MTATPVQGLCRPSKNQALEHVLGAVINGILFRGTVYSNVFLYKNPKDSLDFVRPLD